MCVKDTSLNSTTPSPQQEQSMHQSSGVAPKKGILLADIRAIICQFELFNYEPLSSFELSIALEHFFIINTPLRCNWGERIYIKISNER